MRRAAARKVYDEAMAAAWKAFDEAIDDAIAPARKAYDEAIDDAIDDAIAPAGKAYAEAIAVAWKAYLVERCDNEFCQEAP